MSHAAQLLRSPACRRRRAADRDHPNTLAGSATSSTTHHLSWPRAAAERLLGLAGRLRHRVRARTLELQEGELADQVADDIEVHGPATRAGHVESLRQRGEHASETRGISSSTGPLQNWATVFQVLTAFGAPGAVAEDLRTVFHGAGLNGLAYISGSCELNRASCCTLTPRRAVSFVSYSPIRIAGNPPNQPRALVIDDEPDICELLTPRWAAWISHRSAASDVRGARKKRRSPLDICLTDMRLPDGDGLELVE